MTQLAEKAMLVNLHIARWSARKLDRDITREVAKTHGASDDVGNFNKLLLDKEHLSEIQATASKARTFHYEHTLPWSDGGNRILPATLHLDYHREMAKFRDEFEGHASDFVRSYPDLIERARTRLNGMFNPGDYPSQQALRQKFLFQIHIGPVPRADDFRVDLQVEEICRIREDIERRSKVLEREALRDLSERLHKVVAKMANKLSDPKAIFRDSLVKNVAELCDLLPKLNVSDDPRLNDVVCKVKEQLASKHPSTLRHRAKLRRETAEEARSLAGQVSQLMTAYTGKAEAAA